MLRIYNTRTRTVEEFKPERGNRVYMFVCGPTVYDHSHIGHARTYLAYDIIARYLRAKGYSLFYLMNITDIDDKIINRANQSGQDPIKMADSFTREFMHDMEALGITSVNLYAKASEHVPEIIAQISTLIKKGFAYEVEGDVYYDVTRFPDYGKLSGQRVDELATHRIDPDPRKRNVVDFALWKAQKPGEPFWESPWGKGRPGWHIEDTAITTTYFGPTYDIHGGGLDLVFPHHEAEIAQAEAATGVKPLVRFWVHGGLLMIRGERMGHSLGNFVTIGELLQKHDAEALRLYYGMRHYRTQLSFDEEDIKQAEEVLDKLRSVYNQFQTIPDSANHAADAAASDELNKLSRKATGEFDEAMDDDFNTPRALAVLIAYSKNVEPFAARAVDRASVELVTHTFNYFGSVFGIFSPSISPRSDVIGKLLDIVLNLRQDARRRGDWATADRLRQEIVAAGVGLEDTSAGTRWYLASAGIKKST
ncbi:MAG TPA: cysteine--tRNA ligase [archaeon]|nr:cysteine--tRNA ligase [archaeon]